jgi:hypothetical protein
MHDYEPDLPKSVLGWLLTSIFVLSLASFAWSVLPVIPKGLV